jgi:hypothetical protein
VSTFDAQRLYDLLPTIYRIRDQEQGGALRALLAVIAEQVAVLEEDIDQLYDDQFIETAAEWVVPYIGDLIGARGLHERTSATTFSQRAQVANTLAYRRRKGTAAIIEQLARDTTNWDSHVVEFFQLLATTQHLNHLRMDNVAIADIRNTAALERLNTPFDVMAHTAEVRRISSGRGKYNIPNVGVFLFRLRAYPLTRARAFRVDGHRYTFHPLGFDSALYNLPESETSIAGLSDRVHVPLPIGRREDRAPYYGEEGSILIFIDDEPVEAGDVRFCDLSDDNGAWAHSSPTLYSIDPVLGRLALPTGEADPGSVDVTFYYGSSADMGGGEYDRAAQLPLSPDREVSVSAPDLQSAADAVSGGGSVRFADSSTYAWNNGSIQADAGAVVTLYAADATRPTLVLTGDLAISGGENSEVILDGLLIAGGVLRVTGSLGTLRLRHCTIVPTETSLIVESPNVNVEIDRCILGGVRVADGSTLRISSSILDVTALDHVAYVAPDGAAGGAFEARNCTIRGRVSAARIEATNVIFLAERSGTRPPVYAERRQQGCVRFSFVPPNSQVPQRYQCQPRDGDDPLRVRPIFTSMNYGDAGYFQLSQYCPAEIRQGADDESEMGAFHDLYTPQRETNLRVRLDEFLRFGLEAGIFYAS